MNVQGSWDEFVTGLCDLAVRFEAETYLYESVVVLSARAHVPDSQAGSIRVSRFDGEAARVETGWCFNIVVDYVFEGGSRPVPALEVVEAICSGRAAGSCLLSGNGEWVGILSEAWTIAGSRWTFGTSASAEQRVTRRFPSWIDPT
ncbi:hypothetical protein ACIA5E_29095 [Nocardia asteroides]|uniref:hypothetical protein n=1 Tax=Nocardia asteroides TaxID=1824 RepID=UPI0037934A61